MRTLGQITTAVRAMEPFEVAELQYAIAAYDVLISKLELDKDPQQLQKYFEAAEADVLAYIGPENDPLNTDARDWYRAFIAIPDVVADMVEKASKPSAAVFTMYDDGCYGAVVVSGEVFNQLDSAFFITKSDATTKYLCANAEETKHLEALGVDISGVVCDWFKVVLKPESSKPGDKLDEKA